VLPLHPHQHHEIAGDVGLLHLKARLAGGEEPAGDLERGLAVIETAARFPAVRGHQGVVITMIEDRDVLPDVAADVGVGGAIHQGDQLINVGRGDLWGARHGSLSPWPSIAAG
jgi:hypothetical protein